MPGDVQEPNSVRTSVNHCSCINVTYPLVGLNHIYFIQGTNFEWMWKLEKHILNK